MIAAVNTTPEAGRMSATSPTTGATMTVRSEALQTIGRRLVGMEAMAAGLSKIRVWLGQGFIHYGKHFGSREFLRNNFNVASVGAALSVIDQIWINGRMTLPEVLRSRLIATLVDMAGAGDATVSGHTELLKLFKITPETPEWKRRLVEWPVMVVGVAGWNFAQYFLGGVAPSHYLRSVCISTMIGVGVQMGLLRAYAILNNYATDNPKYCQSISARLSRAFGCQSFSARTKRRLYWSAIVGLNAFMVANWVWGGRLRHVLFGP